MDSGIAIVGDGSFSIDQQRYNGQFAGQVFYEVKGGKIVGMLKDVAYQFRTPEFWGAMDMIGGPRSYYLGGAFGDAQGPARPVQLREPRLRAVALPQVNIINTGTEERERLHDAAAALAVRAASTSSYAAPSAQAIAQRALLELAGRRDARQHQQRARAATRASRVNQVTTAARTATTQRHRSRAYVGKRSASVTTNRLDEASLRAAAQQADGARASWCRRTRSAMPELGPQQYRGAAAGASATAPPTPSGARAARRRT